jgi:hypothetical protein
MDTAEALKQAMQAVRDAEIPEELWSTALPLALADLRGSTSGGSARPAGESTPPLTPSPAPARRATKGTARRNGTSSAGDSEVGIFESAATDDGFLERVAHRTGTQLEDLKDVFHVENGGLHLKVVPRNLGANDKAKTMTVTALMGGAVFAGTDVPSIPFSEIHDVCKTMRCFSTKHAAEYIRETDGFGSIGSGKASSLTHKTGWEAEFAKAVDRTLGKGDSES